MMYTKITTIQLLFALENIPDHPDGHHDVCHPYHSTTFCLMIPKIYDMGICCN